MSNTFCPLPWNFLAVRNNGDLRVCCQANVSESKGLLRDENGALLNASKAVFTDSRNATLFKQTRQDMLAGRWPELCTRCKTEEAHGLHSRRKYENEAWKMAPKDVTPFTGEDGSIDTTRLPIRYFDIRFGNKCNLACRMCGPYDSDAWYGDYVALTNQTTFHDTHGRVQLEKSPNGQYRDPSRSYNWYEEEHFWREMESHSTGLAHVYFAGGEPLLIEQHYQFLENCVTQGIAKQMSIEYNTNCTVLPTRVLELWAQFKKVRLGFSVDGVGAMLEYQRYPAKWTVIEKNLRKINDLQLPNIDAWLACTVTAYNVFHLPEFLEWKLTAGLNNINRSAKKPIITHHMAHKPEHLNVRVLPDPLKEKLAEVYAESLQKIASRHGSQMHEAANRIYSGILQFTKAQSYHEKFWPQFVSYTTKLDRIRRQSHQDVLHSDLSAAIES